MKLSYLNVNNHLLAVIKKDEGGELHVAVENMTPKALLDIAQEMRDDAQARLSRAALIEQAALLI